MIDLEPVSKEYKRGGPLALDDISLHVDDGEFVFLPVSYTQLDVYKRQQQSWSGNGIMKQKGSSLSMRHLLEHRH